MIKHDSLDKASLNNEALSRQQVYITQSVPFTMYLSTEVASGCRLVMQ